MVAATRKWCAAPGSMLGRSPAKAMHTSVVLLLPKQK